MPELHTKHSVLLLAQLAMTVKLIGKLLGEYLVLSVLMMPRPNGILY